MICPSCKSSDSNVSHPAWDELLHLVKLGRVNVDEWVLLTVNHDLLQRDVQFGELKRAS